MDAETEIPPENNPRDTFRRGLELTGALLALAVVGLDGLHTLLEILRSALDLLLEIRSASG